MYFCRRSPSLSDPLVNANVFLRRSVPGKVPAHPVAHELLPGILLAEGAQRFFNRQQKSFAVVVAKLEAGTLAGASVPMLDRVVEAAGGTDDGNRAVLQAVNLVEAARLVPGRHEKHVTARLNLVRDGVVIGHLDRNFPGKLFTEAEEHLF